MRKIAILAAGISIVATALVQQGCRKETGELKTRELKLPATAYSYNDQSNLPSYAHGVSDINNEVATLGRVLFYDNILSLNNTVACASCHKQSLAFSDNVAFSSGFMSRPTGRNSMAILNLRESEGLFWDLRESRLTDMVIKPVQNHIEMGFDNMEHVVAKMNAVDYYKPLFYKAYASNEISEEGIQEALAAYLRSMVTYSSKYDAGVNNNFNNFNSHEKVGMELFRTHCSSCHSEPEFRGTWQTQANIGLDRVYVDQGIQNGFFKIPSLRNIALTAPYMHDGRFKTLDDVVEHYNSGIQDHPNLNWELRGQNGKPQQLNLTPGQKDAMVAFLNTLTDWKFVNDQRFANPFN
jgi:cytochrome c peroxidase